MTAALAFAFVLRVRGEWIWDDVDLVQQNRELVAPGGLWSILTHDLFGGAGLESQPVYRPIPMLLHWLEAHTVGIAIAPMRLVNIALHTLNGALLVIYVRRLGYSELASQTATAVFLLHPSVTEPVMWLSGSHDLLGVLFTLAALLAVPRWWLAAVFCALACLSKELYVVTPLLLLLEPVRQRRFEKQMLLPFAGIAAVFVLRRALGIGSGSDAIVFGDVLRCAGTLLLHYAVQIATFTNGITTETYAPVPLAVALVVLVGFGAAVFVLLRRRMPAGTALAWFGIALAPLVIALPVNGRFANRYAYLPLIGVTLLIAYGVSRLETRLTAGLAPFATGAMVAGALVLVLSTAGEASEWASALALFGADVERAPNDPHALFYYGNAVSRRRGCGEALPFYQRAVAADPTYQTAWHNVAGCLINAHRYKEAIAPAERALALAPGDARAEYNLGTALAHVEDRKAEAAVHLDRAKQARKERGPRP